ncbi:MAG: hypothetical protein HUJ68_07405 [Clostridia bacterium]|nr:hypothetical protein [Clostridia bacterium]
MKFNLGKPENYCSQRNNEYKKTIKGDYGTTKMEASCMCNVTVMSEALEIGNWIQPKGNYKQNEDNLCDFMITESLKPTSYYATHFPAMWKEWIEGSPDAYWPNEVHKVLEHETNEWLGCSHADTFIEGCAIVDIIKQLWYTRMPIPISVKFGNLNHIVLLTGFETSLSEKEVADLIANRKTVKIDKWIYDDPYGAFNWTSKTYPATRGTGDDQIMTNAQFIANVKPLGATNAKYAHILHRPAAVV